MTMGSWVELLRLQGITGKADSRGAQGNCDTQGMQRYLCTTIDTRIDNMIDQPIIFHHGWCPMSRAILTLVICLIHLRMPPKLGLHCSLEASPQPSILGLVQRWLHMKKLPIFDKAV